MFSVLNVFLNTFFPILIFPYIARVLGAEGLGIYSYYNLNISYLALIASFGIGIYGVKEIGKYKDNFVKRSQVALELFCLNFINAIIVFTLILFFTLNSDIEKDSIIIFLFSSILIINALGVEWFFVGLERQKYILMRSFIIKLILVGFIFYFVKSEQDLLNYIIIVVMGLAVPAVINFYFFIKNISFSQIKKLNLKRHVTPLFSIFIVEVSFRYFGMSDLAILGISESKLNVGYYSLALNIFSIVISFLRISAVTLLPRASYYLEKNHTVDFNNLINVTIKFILLVGIPISVGIYYYSDFIVTILGGVEFDQSSGILRAFSPLVIISSIVNMIVFQVLYPQNRIKSIGISFLIGISFNMCFNYFLIPYFGSITVVISSIISQLIILLLLILNNREYISASFFSKDQLLYVGSGTVLFIFLALIESLNIIVQIGLGSIIYFGVLFMLKEQYFTNVITNWLKR